ncbi:MAG: Erythromycin esterase [Gemmatimonadetes bacterium]|nr:Erythromycin esterase [Gemmatimonadota bacterium]
MERAARVRRLALPSMPLAAAGFCPSDCAKAGNLTDARRPRSQARATHGLRVVRSFACQDLVTKPFHGSALAAALASVLFAGSLSAQLPTNLGFEAVNYMQQPAGWHVQSKGYEITLDSSVAREGHFALRTRWTDTAAYSTATKRQALVGQVIAVPAGASRVRLSGLVRTENVRTGIAQLWMFVTGIDETKSRANAQMPWGGPPNTTPWARFDIEVPIDSAARRITFGVRHAGDGTVWFDSLALSVVGGGRIADDFAFVPTPRPPEDSTRLLTDDELALRPDSVPVREKAEYSAWVASHARPIRSLLASDFSDLRFLAPLLTQKRVVQLGESGHGVAEFSMAKVRMIRYLHEELGYDVIAFESSLYECYRAQREVATLSAVRLMRSCVYGTWHVSEVLPLFEYLRETERTKRPLILAGVDQQTSAATMAYSRPEFFRHLLSGVDSTYARAVHNMDAEFLASKSTSSPNTTRFVAFYDSLARFFATNRVAIRAANHDDPAMVDVARQTALSLAVDARRDKVGAQVGAYLRDSAMAANLDFLLDDLYAGKKVIVWAHNGHIRYDGSTRSQSDTTRNAPHSMGAFIAAHRRAELYTVGLFMYQGAAAWNDRRAYPIAPTRSGSLESILHRAPWRYSFLDFSMAKREVGNEWIWHPLSALSWGTTEERLVPRDEYDGVLFIDTVHLPHYLYAPFTTTTTP